MENMWSPWRGIYVTSPKGDKCVFCEKARNPNDDEANYVVHRGHVAFVVMNIYPYNNGHVMLMPYRHIPDILEFTGEEMAEMDALLRLSIQAIRSALSPEGFNIGYNIGTAAGAGIAGHIHQHIVPRWNGDTNFMPVLAEHKVISEHLDMTYKRIKDSFRRLV
ncbi:HIT domain-containing protein [Deferribacterales bacterium RsTz2092]|nr:hydrolase [Deferribacterales bacterium]